MVRTRGGALYLRPVALGLLLAAAPLVRAQQPAEADPPPPPGSIYTLHVYTNLMQMPVLVLGPQDKVMTSLTREQFKLRIDSGPMFHPLQMHREDAEPLLLATLLDASGTEPQLVRAAPAALASLAAAALTAKDQMAISSFDCAFARLPQTTQIDAGTIAETTQQVLKAHGLHGTDTPKSTCFRTSRLRDSMAMAISSAAGLGTRRALVVITDGFDRSSKLPWKDLQAFAVSGSMAVFVIRTGTYYPAPFEAMERRDSLAALSQLCRVSGGMMLSATPETLGATLAHIVELLRSRYILEFPRPLNSTAGVHGMEVQVSARDARVLYTGANAPLAKAEETDDPGTIKGDPTRAPVQGTRPMTRP